MIGQIRHAVSLDGKAVPDVTAFNHLQSESIKRVGADDMVKVKYHNGCSFKRELEMSGRMHWTTLVAVIIGSFAVWFMVGSWLDVSDPAPGAALMSVISITCYLALLGWFLKAPGRRLDSKVAGKKLSGE